LGEVFSINISLHKGTSKFPVEKAYLVENSGIREDAHAGFFHRQISLLSWESIEKENLYLEKEKHRILKLKPGDFAENITTKGIDLSSLKIGDKIKVGQEVLLEISQIGKKCHTLCEISKKIGRCIMPKQGVFAKVLKGGWVKKGDPISLAEKDKNRHSNSK